MGNDWVHWIVIGFCFGIGLEIARMVIAGIALLLGRRVTPVV